MGTKDIKHREMYMYVYIKLYEGVLKYKLTDNQPSVLFYAMTTPNGQGVYTSVLSLYYLLTEVYCPIYP